ncbi:MAG: Metallophosphoesterase [Myxococcaceae bacterium]|nr:Metallophosphoesterase [Myxococcaceae bacterium]
MLRIAHISDLHVLSRTGVELRRVLFNKRVTGYANLLTHRARNYRRENLLAVIAAAAAQADHLVVTGDITNLSLEGEYVEARRLLDEAAGSAEVTVVPGNHDIYLPIILHERRFPHHFSRYMHSDLPELALALPAGHFPSVKLRGPAAIIGLTTAVPRPPFVSAGLLGREQREALARVLRHPEVARRTPVILLHHSPFDSRFRLDQLRGGLVDARELRETLQPLPRGLVLYGHLHERRHQALTTGRGALDAVCATAAALGHPDDRIRAAFNLYELDDDGRIASIRARVLEPDAQHFRTFEFPLRPESP